MNTEELRSKNIKELNEELLSLRKEQFTLRMQKAVGQASRFHQFKVNKKNIARVKTIINQKMSEKS